MRTLIPAFLALFLFACTPSTCPPCAAPSPVACVPASPLPSPTLSAVPSPSPSPAVSPSPSPSPSAPSPSPSPVASPSGAPVTAQLFGMINEVVPVELRSVAADEALPVVDGLRVEAFEILQLTTTQSSCRPPACAAPGQIEYPVFPVSKLRAGALFYVELTPLRAGTFSLTLAGKSFTVKGLSRVMPARPSVPLYAEMQFAQIARAHGLADEGSTLVERCKLAMAYSALLLAHGVQPTKNWYSGVYPPVSGGKIDLDGFQVDKACSFRSQVLTGAIAPPMLWGPDPDHTPSPAVLAAAQASVAAGDLPAGTAAYVWDEGEGVPALDKEALNRATITKPFLDVFITRRPSATFRPFVTTFCPNESLFVPGSECTYPSCMQNGNCANLPVGTIPAAPRPQTMAVMDAPPIHWRAFRAVAETLGVKQVLYYNTTQRLPSAWAAGGLYEQGGNADGTKVLPGIGPRGTTPGMKGLTSDVPIPTLELKGWRQGWYDAEYQKLGRAAGILPTHIRSQDEWSKDPADYDAYRERVARAILGL